MATTNEQLRDLILRHEIRTRRYSKELIAKIVALLEQSNQAARDRIAARLAREVDTGPWTTAHMQAVVNDIQAEIARWRSVAEATVRGELVDLARYEQDWQAGVINQASPIEFNVTRPSPELTAQAVLSAPFQGRFLRDLFADMERAQVTAMSSAVAMGVVQGFSIRDIVRQVRDAGGMGERHAATIVRTAISTITNTAREETYSENTDIIKGEQFVATLDGRTTPECRALDGKTFDVGEGPIPPLHFNCRSVRIPITKSWEELGFPGHEEEDKITGTRSFIADDRPLSKIPESQRARLVGNVPATTSYNQWLRTQPRSFVEEVLGKRKAALYLDGNLPLDRFVDDDLKPLTLERLQQREPIAWTKAFSTPASSGLLTARAEKQDDGSIWYSYQEDGLAIGRAHVDDNHLAWIEVEPELRQQGYGERLLLDLVNNKGVRTATAGSYEGNRLLQTIGKRRGETNTFDLRSPDEGPAITFGYHPNVLGFTEVAETGEIVTQPLDMLDILQSRNQRGETLYEVTQKAFAMPTTASIATDARERLRTKIVDELYGEGAELKAREAHIILGLPASGKSALAKPLAAQTGSLEIDSDEAKKRLPEYGDGIGAAAVHTESSEIIWERIYERAVTRGDNIVLPLVGKTYNNIYNIITTLKRFGYTVHVEYMQVPVNEAIRRAVNRYMRSGRFVMPEYLADVGDKPKATYDRLKAAGLADTFEWYNNLGSQPRYVPGR